MVGRLENRLQIRKGFIKRKTIVGRFFLSLEPPARLVSMRVTQPAPARGPAKPIHQSQRSPPAPPNPGIRN
jgi:hypothetical protein